VYFFQKGCRKCSLFS